MTHREFLVRLGRGDTIASVCAAACWTRTQFDAWWRDECKRRVPATTGNRISPNLSQKVRIARNRWGVAHVYAEKDADLFFGFGYAVAQDRLFQLDYLRRKARGRLVQTSHPIPVSTDR